MPLVMKKKIATVKTPFGQRELVLTRYADGKTLAVLLVHPTDPTSSMTFSTNLDGWSYRLAPGEFYAKTWGENANLEPCIVKTGLIEYVPGRDRASGFIKAKLYRLKDTTLLPDAAPSELGDDHSGD